MSMAFSSIVNENSKRSNSLREINFSSNGHSCFSLESNQKILNRLLEKALLILEQKDKEIVYIKEMIEQKDKEIV
jgi:hypothetical protein